MKDQSRREFFRRTSCAALGAAAMSAGVKKLGLMSALAQDAMAANGASALAAGPYKALVCIFLYGGNDANNMIVPADTTGYGAYTAARGTAGLAIPLATLLPITPAGLGPFGLHPSLTPIQTLFNQSKVAIVANVGPLVQPLTRTQYRSGGARPYQLFSHNDQQEIWQSSRADARTQSGWGGRAADRVVSMNGGSGFPIVTSVAGSAVFAQGLVTQPLGIAPAPTALNQVLVLNGFNTTPESVARKNSMDFLRTIDRTATLVSVASDQTEQAIQVRQDLQVDPIVNTVFPGTGLGNQLKQVAKVMKLNQTSLGLSRQVFFCSLGGFDTHQNQLAAHTQLYGQLSNAMKAFYDATVELGLQDAVTTFTLSDFGRTLAPSGTNAGNVGSDHAWGNHQFVMGGSVLGGKMYGTFPTLSLGGPDDTDNRGRWIPTTAVDQYAATLSTWFGVPSADLPTVFPLLNRFATPNLGFV
ncbi:MAG: DUF1501 domain-containing protein [Acidobacteriota bacterium]